MVVVCSEALSVCRADERPAEAACCALACAKLVLERDASRETLAAPSAADALLATLTCDDERAALIEACATVCCEAAACTGTKLSTCAAEIWACVETSWAATILPTSVRDELVIVLVRVCRFEMLANRAVAVLALAAAALLTC